MTGETITITNVGVFGLDAGTPILNPGEAAILCLRAIRDTPWAVETDEDYKFAVRRRSQVYYKVTLIAAKYAFQALQKACTKALKYAIKYGDEIVESY